MLRRRLPLWLVGGAALLLPLLTWSLPSSPVRASLREWSLDLLLPWLPTRQRIGPEIAIVDLDGAALDRFGPWPWPRARLAQVVGAVAKTAPAVIAIDILLEGRDRFSAEAWLDLAPDPMQRARLAAAVADFPDGDAQLGDALSAAASALGFVLDPSGPGTPLPVTPVLLSTPLVIPDAWRANSVIGPEPRLAAGAQGFGGLVMAADFDGRIRRVPLLVVAGRALRPGLAVEAVRLAQAASALLIQGDGRLRVGDVVVPLGPDASLRLVQRPMSAWASRTISLSSLLDGSTPPAALAGHIVLIGSSAPELGGLRVTPASPVTPSVQIQAEAISTLLRGHVAFRPAWLDAAETLAAVCLGLLGALFAHRLRPALAATLATLLCVGWSIAALVAVPAFGWLVDPAGPGLLALLIYGLSALVGFVGFEWRARRLRVRFEQHLSPEVVRRIAADPAALRLTGELREVSTLFTDIEGFTPMTERADPAQLVALLDAYFEAVTSVVTANGGMVDKIVGDAVHALFNVPLPLTDHAARAVSCASEILDATEAVRRSTLGRRLMLGRTRIGVETGTAIVGDVGGARKLDYTALGNPINTAARLEQANKELGSSICIGPGTAARIDPALLQPLAILTVRGQSQPIQVFTPARPG